MSRPGYKVVTSQKRVENEKESTDPQETELANRPAGNPTGEPLIPPERVGTPTQLSRIVYATI